MATGIANNIPSHLPRSLAVTACRKRPESWPRVHEMRRIRGINWSSSSIAHLSLSARHENQLLKMSSIYCQRSSECFRSCCCSDRYGPKWISGRAFHQTTAGIAMAAASHDPPPPPPPPPPPLPPPLDGDLYLAITELIERIGRSNALSSLPEDSLRNATWTKLICGASFEDVADVRNLSLVYTLAGVDCVDCAADPAVVAAVKEGIDGAMSIAAAVSSQCSDPWTGTLRRPWIMVSINDDEDPHFRKAEFDSNRCPSDCPRPCERVCPVDAIQFKERRCYEGDDVRQQKSAPAADATAGLLLSGEGLGGVVQERCYGCGRCIAVCPFGLIEARSYSRDVKDIGALLSSGLVDALEIHTRKGHSESFVHLWSQLNDHLKSLRLVAVSVPDLGAGMPDNMTQMYRAMRTSLDGLLLWQLDGRPMSGDIGAGATRAAVALAKRILEAGNGRPPGYLQLAGGTNAHTVAGMKSAGIWNDQIRPAASVGDSMSVAGVAYGGYARKILKDILEEVRGDTRLDQSVSSASSWPRPVGPAGSKPAEARKTTVPINTPEGEFHASSETNRGRQRIEANEKLLLAALRVAAALIGPLKHYRVPHNTLTPK